MTEWIFNMKH